MTWQMPCHALTNLATESFGNSVAEFKYLTARYKLACDCVCVCVCVWGGGGGGGVGGCVRACMHPCVCVFVCVCVNNIFMKMLVQTVTQCVGYVSTIFVPCLYRKGYLTQNK